MLVSIRPVSHRTKSMKLPNITIPGRSMRWEIKKSSKVIKTIDKAEMVTS